MIGVRSSNRYRFLLLLGFVVSLAGVVALLYQRNPGRGLPFQDQFAKGRLSDWQEYGGTWSIVDGSLRNDSNERGAKIITGSPFWTNYKAEADVQLLGDRKSVV